MLAIQIVTNQSNVVPAYAQSALLLTTAGVLRDSLFPWSISSLIMALLTHICREFVTTACYALVVVKTIAISFSVGTRNFVILLDAII